ncbi:alpha/beta fold hydrolase [Tenacibaculum sp. MAR_2009_124]|uniref:alpha/beta fold hydrolase n=1 Tax=Tenacibaculum sp. MAR_2009_124 TaxID=1250059 RepID=UPI000B887856|nr:alpha/beta hydrolase [Tenacibaculum sp. MAR_2009_124]
MIVKYKESEVFYTDKGKGSAVVLLHGFLENHSMWNEVSGELSKKNRVITVDLLGHGKTDSVGYIHLMSEMALVVQTVLKKLRIRKSYFIGHSMGGYVSLEFAKLFPEKVKGICLMNSTSQEDTEERKRIRKGANEIAKKHLTKLIQNAIPNLFAEDSKEKNSEKIKEVLEQAKQTSVRGYMAANEGMLLRTNNEEVLKQFEKRAIIVGKNDPVLNYDTIVKEAKRTNTTLVEFSNGHMSHIENKELLIDFLKQFVK